MSMTSIQLFIHAEHVAQLLRLSKIGFAHVFYLKHNRRKNCPCKRTNEHIFFRGKGLGAVRLQHNGLHGGILAVKYAFSVRKESSYFQGPLLYGIVLLFCFQCQHPSIPPETFKCSKSNKSVGCQPLAIVIMTCLVYCCNK